MTGVVSTRSDLGRRRLSRAKRTIGRLGALPVLALAAGAIMLSASSAQAAYPVQSQPLTIATGSPTPAPGATVTIEGGGFQPGTHVSIDVHSTAVHLATVTADATGFMKATVTIPTSLAGGPHELTASGPAPGGGTNTLSASFVVSSGSLPFTGSPVLLIGIVGGAVVIAGAGLFLYARRRRLTA